MVQNDDTTRQEYVRRYLPDDAWMAAHILEQGVGALCNIQTNDLSFLVNSDQLIIQLRIIDDVSFNLCLIRFSDSAQNQIMSLINCHRCETNWL